MMIIISSHLSATASSRRTSAVARWEGSGTKFAFGSVMQARASSAARMDVTKPGFLGTTKQRVSIFMISSIVYREKRTT